MRSISRVFLSLFVGALLALGTAPASAGPSLSGSSMGGPSGLTVGAANGLYLRLDGTNTMAAAITSSNGGFTATGATTALTLTGGFVPTGTAAEVGSQIVLSGNFGANDFAFRLFDSTSVALFSVSGDGAGFFTNYVQAANVFAAGFYSLDSVARFVPTASGPNTYTSNDAADGAMVAHTFDTTNLAATTDKLLVVKNQGSEKASFSQGGNLTLVGAIIATNFLDTGGASRVLPSPTGSTTYNSTDLADGAMVAHKFTTTNTAATTDKLLSIQNVTTEKVYFDPVGSMIPVADATTSLGSSTLRFLGYFSGMRVPVIADANGGTRVTLTASGATSIASALAVTGGVDVGNVISVGAADYLAADKVLSIQDNSGTELNYFTGTGDIVPGTTVVSDIGTSAVRWRTTFVQTGNYSNAIVTPSIFDTGSAQTRAAFTVTGKSAYTANTTLTGGEDLGHTFFLTTDFGDADKVLQWGDSASTELGYITGGGAFRSAGTAVGANAYRMEIAGISEPTSGAAYGVSILPFLDPPTAASGISLSVNPQMTADAGETHPQLTGLSVDGYSKLGTGTITTAYGINVTVPSVGTNNIAISTTGVIQFQRVTDAAPTAPVACAAAYEGSQVYVDDTDDALAGWMCICGRGTDNSTYAWTKMGSAPPVACF